MNKHILIAMDWKNISLEELEKNRAAADAWAAAAANAYAKAALGAAAHGGNGGAAAVEYWITRYFEITGEDREEYEKALEVIGK